MPANTTIGAMQRFNSERALRGNRRSRGNSRGGEGSRYISQRDEDYVFSSSVTPTIHAAPPTGQIVGLLFRFVRSIIAIPSHRDLGIMPECQRRYPTLWPNSTAQIGKAKLHSVSATPSTAFNSRQAQQQIASALKLLHKGRRSSRGVHHAQLHTRLFQPP